MYTGNLEEAVGDVVLVSPQSINGSGKTSNQEASKSDSVMKSAITPVTAQQGVVMVPHSIPGRVVYVSNHNPGEDTRVINVLQGREFNATTNDLQEKMLIQYKMQEPDTYIQNPISEKVVYVPFKENNNDGSSNFVLDTQVTNNTSGQSATMDQTNGPNNTQENIKYIQLNDNTLKAVGSDSNQIPIRVIYLPQQTPQGSGNTQYGVPGVTIHAPNDMQLVQYMPPRTPSPNRTLSPYRTQERALQVAGQVLNMAGNVMKQHSHEDNKTQERIVYVAQLQADQAVYSQYMPQMQYLGGSVPQIAYQGGSIPQIAYQGGYTTQMPNQGGFMQQQMLQREAFIPQMCQPVLMQPSPHVVQDGLYMASPPASSVPAEGLSLLSQPVETVSPSSGLDFLDSNAADESCCCSWFDCFISCCGCYSE